jgi:collagenase-like PrtC family protease
MPYRILPEIINIGIDSLKIEGRIKASTYVATVVKDTVRNRQVFARNPAAYKLKPTQSKSCAR